MYIHYGSTEFDENKWQDIENEFVKPIGGLWASPIDAEYGWRDWTLDNNYKCCNEYFKFEIKPEANVYKIHNINDLLKLPQNKKSERHIWEPSPPYYIDFEKCKDIGIDAIELCSLNNGLYWALYGWDCESIIILNKEIIDTNI